MSESAPSLYGLLLAGGHSTRMQQDKAGLTYEGQPQLLRAFKLLQAVCVRAFVSVRADQTNDPLRASLPQIVDRLNGHGPIGGIHAAQATYPQSAWLVLACDLPFLDRPTLDGLIAGRDSSRLATGYRSTHDGLPEPLCTIFEPSSRGAIADYIGGGGRCPRKFLMQADVCLLDQSRSRALDNVNTAQEYAAAASALEGASSQAGREVRLRVRYHAVLREQAGCSEESLVSTAPTPAALYEQLRERHAFGLPAERLRVAVNAEFADWSSALKDGDVVVFIPPVAGG